MNHSIVVIPTYNEIENIEAIIRKVFSLPKPFDVLIIDDGSPDQTGAAVKELQKEFGEILHLVERKGKLGLGTAYIHGFKWALERGYEYIFEMDADFSHPPEDLIRLYQACAEEGRDAAIGSRYITGVNVVNWPISRVLMSYFAGYYVRMITGMQIMDPTAGFICYTKKVLETIDLDKIRFIGYAFQIEMKFNTWKFGFDIVEVPIIFTDRTKGASKMSRGIFKEAIFGVISLKINSYFKRYIPAKKLAQKQPANS
ncbi:polyprenol monophosphomannose synthase [Dyadobacter sp. CY345]|uniref:polyprenol monophosphomannose synthase n=1 Tax=Dyadobacter sp. CY345 TaxID=2909335 RepID=UPI001F473689|nr:polyprenol monophosphomannose synthase [Dyadobacter sp. CY345]MCF2445752.1 polyprenol monophosphomannose synthase [Dyadobacter sp. CY345]